jgi:Domain of unknown function (DUF4134)
MLLWISWGEYWGWVSVALVLYYGFLVKSFYGWKGVSVLWRWLREKKGVAVAGASSAAVTQGVLLKAEGEAQSGSPHFEMMSGLVAQLKGLLVEAKTADVKREELMSWIQGLLFAHRQLRGTKEELAVNELLKRTCVQEIALELNAEDLEWLWRGKADGEKKAAGVVQATVFLVLVLAAPGVRAQTADGNAGLTQAYTLIHGYYATAVQLMYAIGGVVGLAGAVHVYMKWSRGDHDTQRVAIAWIGACIFLVVVATVVQSFFGL